MTRVVILSVLFALGFWSDRVVTAQETGSPITKSKIVKAEKTADQFVEQFRRTLDFGPLWKNSRASTYECAYEKLIGHSVPEKEKLDKGLSEKHYIAFLNYFFLRAAYIFSKAKIEDESSEERVTPRKIKALEERSKYFNESAQDPSTSDEMKIFVKEAAQLSRLYRRYMPKDAMRSKIWKRNLEYLLDGRKVADADSAKIDGQSWCVPRESDVYYVVHKGVFEFFMVEEKGQMRISWFGIGN